MNPIKKTITLADGREITLETGKLAKQADGAVELRMGNTMLLATIVSAKEAGEGVDFMPLTVEYKEKFSSAGRFPGGFLKREGRAGDYEILTARLVDRVLRPLFPDNYHADTFVNVTLYSADGVDCPDALAGLAATFEGVEKVGFADFVHFAFHHHDVLGGGAYHEFHVGAFELFESGVDDEFAVDTGHTHFCDGAVERYVADGQCRACSKSCERVGAVNSVGGIERHIDES